MTAPIVFAFLGAALLAFIFSAAFKNIALALGIVNRPAGNRHSTRTVPLLGGVAIFISFWIVMLLLISIRRHDWFSPFLGSGDNGFKVHRLIGVLAGTMVIFMVGLMDDILNVHYGIRILAQAAATFIMIHFGFTINFVYTHSLLSLCLTFAWIILIINAFNLLDNMDGLSAGVGLISTFIFFAIAVLKGSWFFVLLIAVFAGSIAGFLPWNLPKAKMFMGDAGSTFIGYMLAHITLSIPFHSSGKNLEIAVLTPILVFAVPLYDTLSVIAIRVKRRQPIFVGDANHFSHRLLVLGMSERRALLMNYILAWTTGLTAILLLRVDQFGAWIILVIFFCMMMLIALLERSAIVKMRLQSKTGSQPACRSSSV